MIDYFDLDAIGAREEPVPVVFTGPFFNLARAIPSRTPDGENAAEIKEGCAATVPLWAAEALRLGGYVAVRAPPPFQLSTFREFKTDALAPSLSRKAAHYYDSGLTLCGLLGNPPAHAGAGGRWSVEGTRLAGQIYRLFQLRYLSIIRSAGKRGFDLSDVRGRLTAWERQLLDSVLRCRQQELAWREGVI